MLTLRFHAEPEVTLGPARAFCIHGPVIRQHPHEEIVSRRANGLWHLLDELGIEVRAAIFECRDRTRLEFEDSQGRVSHRYGPFGRLLFRNEGIFADTELFAILSPTQYWDHRQSGVRWPMLNILAG